MKDSVFVQTALVLTWIVASGGTTTLPPVLGDEPHDEERYEVVEWVNG